MKEELNNSCILLVMTLIHTIRPSSSLYFHFFKLKNKFPYFWKFLKIIFLALIVFFRLVLPIGRILAQVSGSSFLISLPPEIQDPQTLSHLTALNFYLSLYEQDPDWVAFIQQELNHNTPLGDIPGRLNLFLLEERTSSLRLDLIQEFSLNYARNGALLPVEPYILEQALRSYLESIHSNAVENFSILQAAYQDLLENEGGSVFFNAVVSYNHDFLEAQSAKRTWIEAERRWRWEGIALSKEKLERAEYEHAQLLFQYEDRKRGILKGMQLGSTDDQA